MRFPEQNLLGDGLSETCSQVEGKAWKNLNLKRKRTQKGAGMAKL
jgi:hypothetical protein